MARTWNGRSQEGQIKTIILREDSVVDWNEFLRCVVMD